MLLRVEKFSRAESAIMAVPELSKPAELYYNAEESEKYNRNSRITKIQREMALRAIQLLKIDVPCPVILDLGCGSGLSGECISDSGYEWVGADISPSMLGIALRNTPAIGLIKCDLGFQLPFRAESFDFSISISAIQWLFQSFQKEHYPLRRIKTFFRSLHDTVSRRAVLQFYCSKKETDILMREAIVAGFYGGLVVDNEGTKNCKYFLVLDKFKQTKKISREKPPKPSKPRIKLE